MVRQSIPPERMRLLWAADWKFVIGGPAPRVPAMLDDRAARSVP